MARLGVPVGWAGEKAVRSGDHPQRPRLETAIDEGEAPLFI